jgi:hypothetical protein
MPPVPDALVAELDAALMQQILDVPEREREADVHHHRQADDLGARLEPLEGLGWGMAEGHSARLPRLKLGPSDRPPPIIVRLHKRLKPRLQKLRYAVLLWEKLWITSYTS